MKILHSSDWHIGSTLYGKKRKHEYESFFQWLISHIEQEKIDVLLIAGDIFDTALPSNSAQELYYSFLIKLRGTCCRHIVITGGNHDSPSFLNAPKQLLKTLNIHIVGAKTEHPEDEIITVEKNGEKVVILAVPYLRERDLPNVSITDESTDRAKKISMGFEKHYRELTELALLQKTADTTLIAMGHFFAAGSHPEDEGERELYIGSLAQISASVFPKELDYVALGHIHKAQKVGQTEHIRYCGSPLAMNFSEKKSAKKIIQLETLPLKIQEISVPEFQAIKKITGSLAEITKEIEDLKKLEKSVWLEVHYTGKEHIDLKETLAGLTENSPVEVLKFKDQNIIDKYLCADIAENSLEDITPDFIFHRLMKKNGFSQEETNSLSELFREILVQIQENDTNE